MNNEKTIKSIEKILNEKNSFYSDYEYKYNIKLFLNCLYKYDLLNEIIILDNKIIIKPYRNDNYIHFYVEQNYKSKFLIGVIFKEIIIYFDAPYIKINDEITLNLNELLFNYFENIK